MLSHPELNQEEGVVRPFFEELLEATLLLWELVIDLSNVHGLKTGVAVAGVGLTDVHKQVLIKLEKTTSAEQSGCGLFFKKKHCSISLNAEH